MNENIHIFDCNVPVTQIKKWGKINFIILFLCCTLNCSFKDNSEFLLNIDTEFMLNKCSLKPTKHEDIYIFKLVSDTFYLKYNSGLFSLSLFADSSKWYPFIHDKLLEDRNDTLIFNNPKFSVSYLQIKENTYLHSACGNTSICELIISKRERPFEYYRFAVFNKIFTQIIYSIGGRVEVVDLTSNEYHVYRQNGSGLAL
jgi:hypothetical protein